MAFIKITEQPSLYPDLDRATVHDLLVSMNKEDQKVALAVQKVIPQLELLLPEIVLRMRQGGRLFYLGAGTSGRLGVLDASEIPPTFGVDDSVIGLIAGGDKALRSSVEQVEDDEKAGWDELTVRGIGPKDIVVGLAASGTTPFVVGAICKARSHGILTVGICSNPGAPLSKEAEFSLEINVGSEFITGSSRLKSGTA